jgi:hypothetical protein
MHHPEINRCNLAPCRKSELITAKRFAMITHLLIIIPALNHAEAG